MAQGVAKVNDLLIGVVVAIVSALVAYSLGRVQGRQQTVFEKQAAIMVELRSRIRAADKAIFYAAVAAHGGEEDARAQDELLNKIGSLGDYYLENSVWIDMRLDEKIEGIIRVYDDQVRALATGQLGTPPPPHLQDMEPEEVHEEVWQWYLDEGQMLTEELEVEARKLLGVDQRWWQVWR